MPERSRRDHYGVVGLLMFLFAIAYLDGMRISVNGPRIPLELRIGSIDWGWMR